MVIQWEMCIFAMSIPTLCFHESEALMSNLKMADI